MWTPIYHFPVSENDAVRAWRRRFSSKHYWVHKQVCDERSYPSIICEKGSRSVQSRVTRAMIGSGRWKEEETKTNVYTDNFHVSTLRENVNSAFHSTLVCDVESIRHANSLALGTRPVDQTTSLFNFNWYRSKTTTSESCLTPSMRLPGRAQNTVYTLGYPVNYAET